MVGQKSTLVIVLVILLAGCAGFGDGGAGTDGSSKTPTPDGSSTAEGTVTEGGSDDGDDPPETTDESASAETTDDDGGPTTSTPSTEVPPVSEQAWVTDEGVDLQALFQAHAQRLNESGSYRAVVNDSYATAALPNVTGVRVVTRASRTQGRIRQTIEADRYNRFGLTAGTIEKYDTRDGPVTMRIMPENGEVRYQTSETTFSFGTLYLQRGFYYSNELLSNFRYESNGTVIRDGQTLYRFTAEEMREQPDGGETGARNATARLLVTPDGLITEMSFEINGTTSQGESFQLEVTYRVTNLGSVTVQEPDWIDETEDAGSG